MALVYLGLGSNVGDRLDMLRRAIARLGQLGDLACSSVYETEPWGVLEQDRFLNLCCRLQTYVSATQLLASLKAIERELGRGAARRWGPRSIDVDLLTYDNLQLHTATLTVPHPRIAERAFVLAPLAELAPDLRVPGLAGTVRELLEQIPDHRSLARVVAPPLCTPAPPIHPGQA